MTDMTLEGARLDLLRVVEFNEGKCTTSEAASKALGFVGIHGRTVLTAIAALADKDAEIARLTAERDAWRRLVVEHNARIQNTEWELDLVDRYSITIPPELEQP